MEQFLSEVLMQPVQGGLCGVVLFQGSACNKNLGCISCIIAFKCVSCGRLKVGCFRFWRETFDLTSTLESIYTLMQSYKRTLFNLIFSDYALMILK